MKKILNKNIENKKIEESFFDDKILDLTSMKNVFLQMPTMICFNFCLKEMLDLCNVNSETGNKKYFELAKDFLGFLKKDIVLKDLDMGAYINTIKKLNEFINNRDKINCTELYYYFSHMKVIFGNKYRRKLAELLIENIEECKNYQIFENLIETFINELLASGYTYKFLNEIIKEYHYKNIFESPKNLINFLLYKRENYDIYVPLKNFNKRDENFIKNSFKVQDVKIGKEIKLDGKTILEDTYYCHIYFNGNDYYKGLNKQIKRMKSIFNFEKFYIGSKVDFDDQKKCIIKANKYLNVQDKSLENLLKYDYYRGTYKIIDSSISTLRKLTGYYDKEDKEDKEDSVLAKDFFNIIDYSEKDNNTLSIEQFINKWIALETLYSKSPTRTGFDSVLNYMPQILAIDFLRKQLSVTLKRACMRKNKIEEFVESCYNDTIDDCINKIKSTYYKTKITKYKEIIINPIKLNNELNRIMERIKMCVYRIYIFRNRYVHTGETKSYYDIPQYLLCQVLALSIDKFMKSINDLDQMEANNITWDIVFNNILNKYNTIFNGVKILSENYKVDNTLILKKDELLINKDKMDNIVLKILLEKHINLFETKEKIYRDKFKKNSRYYKFNKKDRNPN